MERQISDSEFERIRKLIYHHSGIHLSDHKRVLVMTRFASLLQEHGMSSFDEYCQRVESDKTGEFVSQMVDAISTNHTSFYREPSHFDFLKETALPQVVTQLKQNNMTDLRIWCAAASSGEEPYSLAISLMEYFGAEYPAWQGSILATDISMDILNTAQRGVYRDQQLNTVPAAIKGQYFEKQEGDQWKVSEALKSEITFRRFNLMDRPFPFKNPFHIIFCRNVMIYFDEKTRRDLVHTFHSWTAPGGYLFVGHTESLNSLNIPYNAVRPAIYQRSH